MMITEKKYLIISASLVPEIDFSQVYENSVETLRYSCDYSLTFVKYDITIEDGHISGRPSIYTSDMTEYTHDAMMLILDSETWNLNLNSIYNL